MRYASSRYSAIAGCFAAAVHGLDGIVAPDSIAANAEFQVTFQDGDSDQYRVYLAAALAGVNGPTCYLKNSTSLSSPVSLTIPASVGPSADYYSIAIADLSTSEGATYSNRFNLTGGTGNYTEYETHLGGAPFWDADDLPCGSYACARQCAEEGYPNDLTDVTAYDTMKQCILRCPGVSPAASQTGPAHGSPTGSGNTVTNTVEEAVITLGPGFVVTAVESIVTSDGKTVTEAVLGSRTITLGGAEATVSSKAVSLASNGIEVGGSTTVGFSSAMQTLTTSSTQNTAASVTSAGASASSSGAATRQDMAAAGAVGLAAVAAMLL